MINNTASMQSIENNPIGQAIALEICAATIGSVAAACQGGASRIELCNALSEGGVTPSIGFALEAKRIADIPVNVLIRHRAGDFLYSPDEIFAMERDIRILCDLQLADGIVIGCLTPEGEIDIAACERLIAATGGRTSLTFHRAFDMCANPEKALEQIIDLGFDRLLTSGCAPSAMQGLDMLKRLVVQADSRISIMPAAGVNPANCRQIIEATGAREIHASASTLVPSMMNFRNASVNMGAKDADEYAHRASSAQIVQDIVEALKPLAI